MSQIQGEIITIPFKTSIKYNDSSPVTHDLSSKNDHLSLNDSPIPSEPLSPSSNNFLVKSQEISPIRAVYPNQSPELVDINASSNNFSGSDNESDSSELELREENENEKQTTQEQIVHVNEKRQINSKMCLSPKKDISYNKSNCSMFQYYDSTSKYLSQVLLGEQESSENNTFKENLNKSLNFISKQNLFINNKTQNFSSNDFLNNNNNCGENFPKNYVQNNFNWNKQTFNQGINMNFQQPQQSFHNTFNNFNYPQIQGNQLPFSYNTQLPFMNVQQNMPFNYINHVNSIVNQDKNTMNFNTNINNQIPKIDWNSFNNTGNEQNIQVNVTKQQTNNEEIIYDLKEEAFNQVNNNEQQSTLKSNKKSKKNKKRKNNKNTNKNDKSLNNQDQPNEYLTELFGRLGWICNQCNNFNYESKYKSNIHNIYL